MNFTLTLRQNKEFSSLLKLLCKCAFDCGNSAGEESIMYSFK